MEETEKFKNRSLLYLILILIIIGAFIVWKEVVLKQNIYTPKSSGILRNIEINYQKLGDSNIEDLILFEKITEAETSGRENPFK